MAALESTAGLARFASPSRPCSQAPAERRRRSRAPKTAPFRIDEPLKSGTAEAVTISRAGRTQLRCPTKRRRRSSAAFVTRPARAWDLGSSPREPTGRSGARIRWRSHRQCHRHDTTPHRSSGASATPERPDDAAGGVTARGKSVWGGRQMSRFPDAAEVRRRTDLSLFGILLRAPSPGTTTVTSRTAPDRASSGPASRGDPGGPVMYHRGVERSAVGATFTLVRDPFERRWRSVLTPRRSRQGGKPPCR